MKLVEYFLERIEKVVTKLVGAKTLDRMLESILRYEEKEDGSYTYLYKEEKLVAVLGYLKKEK